MKYPRQKNIIERIEARNHRELKKLRENARRQVRNMWDATKSLLRTGIREFYRRDFGSGTWSLPLSKRKGTLHRISVMVSRVMDDYHQDSISMNNKIFREIYRQSVLRNAYLLDMVTPESYRVALPRNRMFTEASAIRTYQGPDADIAWKVRWSAWVDSYKSALDNNLKMGALNDSDINAAEEEVDATRAGTPAYDMGDAFDRIMLSQAITLQAQAQHDLSELNEEMGLEEVWQTSFSMRVCDICDDQKGLTIDEAEYDIPAHPNCECYWRLVPAQFADLLRSGDASEVDLARWMDANGVVPSSMVVRTDDGDVVGKAMVSFDDWITGLPAVVSAR